MTVLLKLDYLIKTDGNTVCPRRMCGFIGGSITIEILVIPAKAGIYLSTWENMDGYIPAFAGMTKNGLGGFVLARPLTRFITASEPFRMALLGKFGEFSF